MQVVWEGERAPIKRRGLHLHAEAGVLVVLDDRPQERAVPFEVLEHHLAQHIRRLARGGDRSVDLVHPVHQPARELGLLLLDGGERERGKLLEPAVVLSRWECHASPLQLQQQASEPRHVLAFLELSEPRLAAAAVEPALDVAELLGAVARELPLVHGVRARQLAQRRGDAAHRVRVPGLRHE